MPKLGAHLDYLKLEAQNMRIHQLASAPASPVTGQLYYNNSDNTLYWWDGTTWQSAKGGAAGVPDASTTTKGIVQLAGDLTGTATSPQIASGAVTDAEVAAANKDGAAGTASMRTLGSGAAQAMPGNRTLDAISAPVAPVNMNSQRLTSVADPTAATDGANKQYVDGLSAGLDTKASVKAASTANLTLSGTQTIDGIALVAGDRVLVKDQTTASGNGIYVVAAGAWTRATDMDAWAEVPSAYTWVEQGTVNADTGWVCTADQGGTLGSTSVTWTKFSAAPSAQIGYYSNGATHGAGTTITITQATHGLRASRGLLVQVQDNATGNVEIPDISVAATGDVTVTYAVAVAANSKLVTVVG